MRVAGVGWMYVGIDRRGSWGVQVLGWSVCGACDRSII